MFRYLDYKRKEIKRIDGGDDRGNARGDERERHKRLMEKVGNGRKNVHAASWFSIHSGLRERW